VDGTPAGTLENLAMPLEAFKGIPQSVGNYDLIQKIADGGMGTVYKARHRTTGEIVAVKILPASMAANAVLVRRFEQEFKAASSLDHPNIVRALEYGQEGSTPYLVMEYVAGESLGQRIERIGRLPEGEAIKIIVQVAQGLHKAHKQGMVHRDVKPDNILLGPDGQAKLADLGLVKETETDLNLTKTGRGLGTPHFMAPEQFRNAKNADARCDIYSLAATLYMAVTGELPFRSLSPLEAWMRKMGNDLPAPRQLNPGLSERVDWAIRRAMSAEPDQRPATCREFVEDLTGRSTRKSSVAQSGPQQDLWYLVYTDDEGAVHTVKGSLYAIRRSLKDGLLGDASNVRVSRSKAGPFEPLRSHPEFRDLVIQPVALPVVKPASSRDARPAATTNSNPAPILSPPAHRVQPPSYRAPAIDVGPSRAGRRGSDWLTWLLIILLALAGFVFGLYFLYRT
jgi:serine/threonine protein kinase